MLQTVMARLSPAFGPATCETCTVAEVRAKLEAILREGMGHFWKFKLQSGDKLDDVMVGLIEQPEERELWHSVENVSVKGWNRTATKERMSRL